MDDTETKLALPFLPLRDVVIFPHMVVPLFVGRAKSVNGLSNAMNLDKTIFLATQKNAGIDVPEEKDIFKTGTIGTVLQLLRLPDGTVKRRVPTVSLYRKFGIELVKLEHPARLSIEYMLAIKQAISRVQRKQRSN